jgi:hypothetical protein
MTTRCRTHAPASAPTSASTGARRAARTAPALVAAVAAAVLAGCGTGGTSPAAAPADDPAAAPVVLEAPAADGPAAACAPVGEQTLAGADLAVEGVVVGEEDGVVVLDVTRDFLGGAGEQVRVRQGDDEVPGELSAGRLEDGATYLVAAQGDQVLTCGATAASSPELLAVYEAAAG